MDFTTIHKYTKNLNLLYVEDDLDICLQSIDFLETFFKNVTVCHDGYEGLNSYKRDKIFDVVITDINMPKMDGVEMIEEILKLNPKQPIAVTSAQDQSSILLKLINMGIENFLLKPIQEQQLLKTLYKISKNIYNEKLSIEYHKNIVRSNEYLENEVEKRTKALKQQFYTDQLTGLKNRTALSKHLKKNNYNILALVDIDRLQFINDLYGSEIGNQIIKQFANILKTQTENLGYNIYRASGDEFAICSIENNHDKFKCFINDLNKIITHIPLLIEDINEKIYIDATIGVSFEKNQLLPQSDIALKHAKTTQQSLVIYDNSMNTREKMKNALKWKQKIEHALKNDNIIPVFQPIVDSSGNIVKYETLMRLKDEEGELISPYFFLDIAMQTKQYAKLSKTIITKALEHLIKTDVILSINLSYSDFTNPKIAKLITDMLDRYDIGDRLIFEIVESEDIKDYKLLHEFLYQFKKYGVKIALDDFGSGFSNFGNIIKTRPDYIKIDGSLIKTIDKDPDVQIMVKAISQIASELNVKVIAEFVHSKEVFDTLKQFNIDEFQGYYFFKPSTEFVKKRRMV